MNLIPHERESENTLEEITYKAAFEPSEYLKELYDPESLAIYSYLFQEILRGNYTSEQGKDCYSIPLHPFLKEFHLSLDTKEDQKVLGKKLSNLMGICFEYQAFNKIGKKGDWGCAAFIQHIGYDEKKRTIEFGIAIEGITEMLAQIQEKYKGSIEIILSKEVGYNKRTPIRKKIYLTQYTGQRYISTNKKEGKQLKALKNEEPLKLAEGQKNNA